MSRRWVLVLVAVAVVVGAVVAALPLVAERLLRAELLARGAAQVEIGDVSLNPFTGGVLLTEFAAHGDDGARLALEHLAVALDLPALFDRRLHLRSVELAGGHLDVVLEPVLRLGPLALGAEASEPPAAGGAADAAATDPWQFGIDALQVSDLVVSSDPLPNAVRVTASAGPLHLWEDVGAAQLDLQLAMEQTRLQARGEIQGLPGQPAFVGRLAGQDIDFANPQLQLQLGAFAAADVRAAATGVAIAHLELTDLVARVQRMAVGSEPQSQPSPEPPQADRPPLSVRIGELAVVGDSRLGFSDDVVEPPFELELAVASLQATGLDSAADTATQVKLELLGDANTRLALDGTVGPRVPNLSLALTGRLEGFDLSTISQYVQGYDLQRGRLNVDMQYAVASGELELRNAVVVEKLKLLPSNEGQDPLQAQGSDLSLDVMLSLLRDGDDRIVVDLPITGSMDDPDFGVSSIVRNAVRTGLQRAAMTYAKNALQPVGVVLLAADLFGKAKRPRFEPMQFAPGAAELEASQLAYARQLADLLEARPRLTVTVCGVATPGEGALGAEVEAEAGTEAATADGALALARERADALAALLRERVDAARVFDCLPEVDAAPAAVPRVEILL